MSATVGGVTWRCDHCNYPNDDGDGKFARCSICGGEDFTKVDTPPAPSTVGTVEELEALPPRTIVRDADGDEWLLNPARLAGDQRVFLLAIHTGNSYRAERVALPATVLTPTTTRDVGGVTAEDAWDEGMNAGAGWAQHGHPPENPYSAASAKGGAR